MPERQHPPFSCTPFFLQEGSTDFPERQAWEEEPGSGNLSPRKAQGGWQLVGTGLAVLVPEQGAPRLWEGVARSLTVIMAISQGLPSRVIGKNTGVLIL